MLLIDIDGTYQTIYIKGKATKYQVSTTGKVRNSITKKVLKPVYDRKKYLRVCLTLENSKKYTAKVHRLVAEAFIPNPKNKPTVNHINGIHDDNNITNLEWATYSEQSAHAIRTNLIPPAPCGVDNPSSKFSENQINMVCRLLEERKLSQREIHRITGVSVDVINRIKKKKSWVHISKNYNIIDDDVFIHYSDDVRNKTINLIKEGYCASKIIDILGLPKTQASYSFIYNIRQKLKKEKVQRLS